ncbi:Serine/threonine-protein phosphatase 2A activator 1 [Tilletia horrida]|uniref:Serine/threonine-protein phosphatase 2A activator n=1 Tax=Tilletia horrida TaxID=155126 RepID=A0AAN6JQ54_9BASI|nr:Serine/threonine-protein phosphatase 2A activator 1 [Tilletia horrida]KAK0538087.1 Serine/threonine-protein phosphatase 2A activator 1 [Tilletia horrida]
MTAQGSSSRKVEPAPLLPRIDAQDAQVLARIQTPVKRLYTDADLVAFQASQAHRIFNLFVARLAEASIGRPLLSEVPESADGAATLRQGAQRVLKLLAELDQWTRDIEREQGPQRFGNIAFRDWGKRLEERARALHEELLPPHLHPFIVELLSPFLSSFGNFTRIDYGSGHELSFALWLCLLFRLNFFGSYDAAGSTTAADGETGHLHQETERIIALLLLPAYLRTVYAIQDRYSLEPAGSHGVWGLDDFHFLSYIIGAAQLSSQESFKPRDILPPVTRAPPLPNLYSVSIARILTLKHGGPFAEHSPMLTDIASSVPTWNKVLAGLMRMYDAEVLGKRVVVQLWDFGGVGWVWEGEVRSPPQNGDNGTRRDTAAGLGSKAMPLAPTAAPWASGGAPPPAVRPSAGGTPSDFAPTGAPWATGSIPAGSALGARLGPSRPMMNLTYTPPTGLGGGGATSSTASGRASLYSTGSAAAASSPFGSLPRSMAVPGRMGAHGGGISSSSGTGARGALRDPLADPNEQPSSLRTHRTAPPHGGKSNPR